MITRFWLTVVFALAMVVFTPNSARAQFTYDTLMVSDTACAAPSIAIGPDGTPHVIAPYARGYRHFWRPAATWLQEVVTPAINASPVDLVNGPSNRLAALRRGAGGQLIVLRPGAGPFWDADTIPGTSGLNSRTAPSLQLDSGDQPVVAFTTRVTGLDQLWLASRAPSGWTVAAVSSSSDGIGEPGLVLDPLDAIHLAVRFEAGPEGPGAYLIEAPTVSGPFTWTRADTLAADAGVLTRASISLDAVTGDPRIVHSGAFSLRYAARSGSAWTSCTVDPLYYHNYQRPPSLALDGAGSPRILALAGTWVLSTTTTGADPACGVVITYAPYYFERDPAIGEDPFAATYLGESNGEASHDAIAFGGGRTHLVWLDSPSTNCWPSRILYNQSPLVLSTPAPTVRAPVLRLAPNPVRFGAALILRLSSGGDAPVTLRIEDVAGRHVVSREEMVLRGETTIQWPLPALRAGWYRVTARQGGAPLGSGSFLVVR